MHVKFNSKQFLQFGFSPEHLTFLFLQLKNSNNKFITITTLRLILHFLNKKNNNNNNNYNNK